LITHGFTQSKSDYSLFARLQGTSFVALLVYVDDIVIASNDLDAISSLTAFLNSQFRLKDIGMVKYFLGLELAHTAKGISVSQRKYCLDIIQDSGLLAAKPASFPMESNLKLSRDDVLSQFMHSPRQSHMAAARAFYDILRVLQDKVFFTLLLQTLKLKPSVTMIGLLVLILNDLLLASVSLLKTLLFPGNPRNNTLFLVLRPK